MFLSNYKKKCRKLKMIDNAEFVKIVKKEPSKDDVYLPITRKNILWLILNKSKASGAYGAIFLSYVEYARRTNDHAIIENKIKRKK